MGHGKETPRQKMIGMMYLVLMAMLALNVSNEVLNAFTILDGGLTATLQTVQQANENIIKDFDAQYQTNAAKVGEWYELAKQVSDKANEIVDFIQENKVTIVKTVEGDDSEAIIDDGHGHLHINVDAIGAKDNTDGPAQIMVGDNNKKAGHELNEMMTNYKAFLLSTIIPEGASTEGLRKAISASLKTDKEPGDHGEGEHGGGDGHGGWEYANFTHLPMAGVISIMSGLQIKVRNAESEALKYLYSGIDAGSYKFNKLEATVIPNSNYIIQGSDYTAEVFLAASDTTSRPTIYVTDNPRPYDSIPNENGPGYSYIRREGVQYDTLIVSKEGKGTYFVPGTRLSLGPKSWGGIIQMKGPSGGADILKPFRNEFLVAASSVVVSPTKMNVFYLGVDNPVSVSVAGIRPENVSIEVRNARATQERANPSNYIVKPKRPGTSMVSVYAVQDGKRILMDTKEFRVKPVPDPVAKVGGKKGGAMEKSFLEAQLGVEAAMEDFDFDLKFVITEFTVSATIGGFRQDGKSKSYKFTPKQKRIFQQVKLGQRVYIEDIKAIGPDGNQRNLPTISLLLN